MARTRNRKAKKARPSCEVLESRNLLSSVLGSSESPSDGTYDFGPSESSSYGGSDWSPSPDPYSVSSGFSPSSLLSSGFGSSGTPSYSASDPWFSFNVGSSYPSSKNLAQESGGFMDRLDEPAGAVIGMVPNDGSFDPIMTSKDLLDFQNAQSLKDAVEDTAALVNDAPPGTISGGIALSGFAMGAIDGCIAGAEGGVPGCLLGASIAGTYMLAPSLMAGLRAESVIRTVTSGILLFNASDKMLQLLNNPLDPTEMSVSPVSFTDNQSPTNLGTYSSFNVDTSSTLYTSGFNPLGTSGSSSLDPFSVSPGLSPSSFSSSWSAPSDGTADWSSSLDPFSVSPALSLLGTPDRSFDPASSLYGGSFSDFGLSTPTSYSGLFTASIPFTNGGSVTLGANYTPGTGGGLNASFSNIYGTSGSANFAGYDYGGNFVFGLGGNLSGNYSAFGANGMFNGNLNTTFSYNADGSATNTYHVDAGYNVGQDSVFNRDGLGSASGGLGSSGNLSLGYILNNSPSGDLSGSYYAGSNIGAYGNAGGQANLDLGPFGSFKSNVDLKGGDSVGSEFGGTFGYPGGATFNSNFSTRISGSADTSTGLNLGSLGSFTTSAGLQLSSYSGGSYDTGSNMLNLNSSFDSLYSTLGNASFSGRTYRTFSGGLYRTATSYGYNPGTGDLVSPTYNSLSGCSRWAGTTGFGW